MNDKLVFRCSACGSKLVVHKYDVKKMPLIDVQRHGEGSGIITAYCFCDGVMMAYPNGADGAFVDDIEKVTDEFERIIEIAYEAASEAVNSRRKHG